MNYQIHRTPVAPTLAGEWDGAIWGPVAPLDIQSFHRQSSDHRPATQAKLLYDSAGLYALFDVRDRYVRCLRTDQQARVCRDSCVELFLQPRPEKGYFNFEINCGGTLRVHHVLDHQRTTEGFRRSTPLTLETLEQVRIYHSMPKVVWPEIVDPVRWRIECFIPFKVMETHVGRLRNPAGGQWHGNLYKCGDETSHPHWASWSPIGEELNFHRPDWFGTLTFADVGPAAPAGEN